MDSAISHKKPRKRATGRQGEKRMDNSTGVASAETQAKKRPVFMSQPGNTPRAPTEIPARKMAKNPAHAGPPSRKGRNWKAWRAGPRSVAPGETMAQEKRAERESIIAAPRPPARVSREKLPRLIDDNLSLRSGLRAAKQSAEAS